MESPFEDCPSSSFSLYLEPFLNDYYKTYQNIISLSNMPTGPLSNMVKMIRSPKLSPFQSLSPFSNNIYNCTYALLRYPVTSCASSIKNGKYFMTSDDLPSVLTYLNNNGYTVDKDMTKIFNKSHVQFGGNGYTGHRIMICMVQYKPM